MLRLSQRDKLILSSIQNRPNVPATEISRALHLKVHTVRRTIAKLEEAKVIRLMGIVNPAALGYWTYEIALSTTFTKPDLKQAFIKNLVASDRVSIICDLGGDYECQYSYLAKNPSELRDFFSELEQKFSGFVFSKAVTLRYSFYGFGRKYLGLKKVSPIIELNSRAGTQKLDEVDHKLCQSIGNREFSTLRDLARTLSISSSTLEYRVNALKRSGLLNGFIYAVDTKQFGMNLLRLLIFTRSLGTKFRDKLYEVAHGHARCVNMIHCLGNWDYELGLEVEDGYDIPQIVNEIRSKFDTEILAIKVLPIFNFHKLSLYPFKRLPS